MFNIEIIRQDFPMLQNKTMQNHPLVYLDNSATTFKPRSVIDAVCNYYENYSVNAHRGDYDLSYFVDQEYAATRKAIAKFINANEDEIIYTSGATQGLNLVAQGYGATHLQKGDVILTSEAEHASCLLPWLQVAKQTQAIVKYIPFTQVGKLDLNVFEQYLKAGNVKVVVLAHVTNVLGYVLDIQTICKIAHQYGAIVVVDGAQSVPHMPVDVKILDCDFLAFSSHKMCGPTGIGALYGKKALLSAMTPMEYGGDSNARYDRDGNILLKDIPYRFESGTQPIEAIYGFHAAIAYLSKIDLAQAHEYEKALHDYAIQELQKMEHIILYNPDNESGIITFNVKDVFAQDGASYFNAHGICVRSGQHCSKLLNTHLGCEATLRASLYFYTSKEEIDAFLAVCKTVSKEACLDIFF